MQETYIQKLGEIDTKNYQGVRFLTDEAYKELIKRVRNLGKYHLNDNEALVNDFCGKLNLLVGKQYVNLFSEYYNRQRNISFSDGELEIKNQAFRQSTKYYEDEQKSLFGTFTKYQNRIEDELRCVNKNIPISRVQELKIPKEEKAFNDLIDKLSFALAKHVEFGRPIYQVPDDLKMCVKLVLNSYLASLKLQGNTVCKTSIDLLGELQFESKKSEEVRTLPSNLLH